MYRIREYEELIFSVGFGETNENEWEMMMVDAPFKIDTH